MNGIATQFGCGKACPEAGRREIGLMERPSLCPYGPTRRNGVFRRPSWVRATCIEGLNGLNYLNGYCP